MRLLFLLLLMLALDAYLFQSLKVLLSSAQTNVRNALLISHWIISALSILFILAAFNFQMDGWNKTLITYLRTLIFIIYLSKFLVFPLLLIDDIRRLGIFFYEKMPFSSDTSFNPGRSKFLVSLGWIIGSIPFLTMTYGMLRNPYRFKVYREKIKLQNFPAQLAGLKIIHISDIHSGSFTQKEEVKKSVDLINKEKPDLVFFTGDLVNNRSSEMLDYMDVFDKIQSKYGVYSVLGNHDYGHYNSWSEEDRIVDLNKLIEIHKKLGWNLLMNDNQILEIEGHRLAIIGVENYSASPRFPKYGDLQKACQGCEDADVKVLLSHDPSHWEDQVTKKFQDIAITFSGHTHGMQFGIEIPGWFKWSPVQYVYPQWAGLYQNKDQYLYVNRGLGFLGYAGRVGILPEITAIELS
jgi:uncharacterized protein